MITDIDSFIRYFGGINRRAVRDIGSLPPQAEAWSPAAGEGESAWSIGQLVSHMAASRVFFAVAYTETVWRPERWPRETRTRAQWVAALNESAAVMIGRLAGTTEDWLRRRIGGNDPGDRPVSGWRVLMMAVEHDVHHRSQIDTYAGIAGWEVQQIYGRKAEDVGLAPAP